MLRPSLALTTVVALSLGVPGMAGADEGSFFDGRAAYRDGDYPRAVALFEDFLLPVPASNDAVLVCQARKYLIAGYVLVRQENAAREEARRLLTEEACRESPLDRTSFPEAVVVLYDEVKAAVEVEEREAAARREAVQREERERQVAEQARVETIRELIEVATTETVEERNSRWVALLPFGIGQIRNGHRRAGLFFAITEGLLAGATLGTFLAHQYYANEVNEFQNALEANPERLPEFRGARLDQLERRFRVSNQVLWATTGAVMIAGVIDAQVRYVPVRTETRRRPLPRSLREVGEDPAAFAPEREEPEEDEKPSDLQRPPDLTIRPAGLGLSLRLRF
ncbi:MAG: hypothetical protein AAGH15_21145 [Myxococcota bacterium]